MSDDLYASLDVEEFLTDNKDPSRNDSWELLKGKENGIQEPYRSPMMKNVLILLIRIQKSIQNRFPLKQQYQRLHNKPILQTLIYSTKKWKLSYSPDSQICVDYYETRWEFAHALLMKEGILSSNRFFACINNSATDELHNNQQRDGESNQENRQNAASNRECPQNGSGLLLWVLRSHWSYLRHA